MRRGRCRVLMAAWFGPELLLFVGLVCKLIEATCHTLGLGDLWIGFGCFVFSQGICEHRVVGCLRPQCTRTPGPEFQPWCGGAMTGRMIRLIVGFTFVIIVDIVTEKQAGGNVVKAT